MESQAPRCDPSRPCGSSRPRSFVPRASRGRPGGSAVPHRSTGLAPSGNHSTASRFRFNE